MNKNDTYIQLITPHLETYFLEDDSTPLEDFLILESGVPTPGANLELAQAFGRIAEDYSEDHYEQFETLITYWTTLSAAAAPNGDPREFLVFCGVIGLGGLAVRDRRQLGSILIRLRERANDDRWRVREAVCFALQRLMYRYGTPFTNQLEQWVQTGTPRELRAAVVSVAEPPLLENTDFAFKALYLHRLVFSRFRKMEDLERESRRVLVQGLSFSLGVVVTHLPDAGFDFMADLAHWGHKDIQKILKSNLAKNRLSRQFPEQTGRISDLLL